LITNKVVDNDTLKSVQRQKKQLIDSQGLFRLTERQTGVQPVGKYKLTGFTIAVGFLAI
jgi:hypothetical protein